MSLLPETPTAGESSRVGPSVPVHGRPGLSSGFRARRRVPGRTNDETVVVRRSSFVVRRSSFVVRRSSFVVRRSSSVVRRSSCRVTLPRIHSRHLDAPPHAGFSLLLEIGMASKLWEPEARHLEQHLEELGPHCRGFPHCLCDRGGILCGSPVRESIYPPADIPGAAHTVLWRLHSHCQHILGTLTSDLTQLDTRSCTYQPNHSLARIPSCSSVARRHSGRR